MKKLYIVLIIAFIGFSGKAQIFFNYPNPICINSAPIVSPNISSSVDLSGAVFSCATPGLVIDSTTGQLNLMVSLPGNYVVTCTIPPAPPEFISYTIVAIVVITPAMVPQFNYIAPICYGSDTPALPTASIDGIVGTWSPSTISNTASASYTFIPATGQCAVPTTISVDVIQPNTVPVFDAIPTFCYGSNIFPEMPSVSNNGIPGTWTSVVSNVMNTITVNYEFTPSYDCAVPLSMTISVIQPVSGSITTPTGSDTVYVDENNAVVTPLTLSNEVTSDDYTYQWIENGIYIEDATAATYTVNTASANGEDRVYTVEMTNILTECSSMSNEFVVHQSNGVAPPSGLVSQNVPTGSTLGDLIVSGTNIQWYASATDKNATVTALPLNTLLVDNTTYYASQTINNVESVERLPVTVHLLLGIGENELTRVSYYPNPIKNNLTIKALNKIDSIAIINLLGQVLKTTTHNQSEVIEDMSQFSAGAYFIRVTSAAKTEVFKVIKQ